MKDEYNALLSDYLQGRASSADLKRLNGILDGHEDLARDFDNQVEMNALLNAYGKEHRAKMAFEAAVVSADTDAPIPLLGPNEPQAVAYVFVAGGGKINPHMRN